METGRRIISEIEESGENSIGILNDNAILGYAAMQRLKLQEKNFLYINLSTGIGAAYFMKGEIFGDAGGKLTQFGHILVHPGGRLCSCGAHGCLEAEIGERALQEQFASYFGKEELKPLLEGELLRKIIDGRKQAEGIYTAKRPFPGHFQCFHHGLSGFDSSRRFLFTMGRGFFGGAEGGD